MQAKLQKAKPSYRTLNVMAIISAVVVIAALT